MGGAQPAQCRHAELGRRVRRFAPVRQVSQPNQPRSDERPGQLRRDIDGNLLRRVPQRRQTDRHSRIQMRATDSVHAIPPPPRQPQPVATTIQPAFCP